MYQALCCVKETGTGFLLSALEILTTHLIKQLLWARSVWSPQGSAVSSSSGAWKGVAAMISSISCGKEERLWEVSLFARGMQNLNSAQSPSRSQVLNTMLFCFLLHCLAQFAQPSYEVCTFICSPIFKWGHWDSEVKSLAKGHIAAERQILDSEPG